LATTLLVSLDPWGREITLTREQWVEHVLARHAEMAPYLSSVAATLTAPTRVMGDALHPQRRNFYRLDALPKPFDHLMLKVCVEFTVLGSGELERGRVITAYPTPTTKRGEVQIWP
jgi:hypothetical protein